MCGACIAPAKGWPGIAVLPGAAHLPCEEYHSNVKLKIPNLLADSVILTRQPVASCLYKQALIKGAIDWNCLKIAYEMNVRACIGGRDWAIVLVGRLVKGTSSSGTNAWCGWCVSWGAWKTVFGINFAILRLLFKMRTNLSPLNKHFRGREATDERWKTYVFIVRSSRSCGLKNRKITLGLRKKKNGLLHTCTCLHAIGAGVLNIRQRPYHVERTRSRQLPEVKLRRVPLVLGWVTAWEYGMQLALDFVFFFFS